MRSEGRSSGGVSEQARRIDQTHKREAADHPCLASMTSLHLPERMNELSDGVIRPFNATRERRRGSTSEIPAEDCLTGRLCDAMQKTPRTARPQRRVNRLAGAARWHRWDVL